MILEKYIKKYEKQVVEALRVNIHGYVSVKSETNFCDKRKFIPINSGVSTCTGIDAQSRWELTIKYKPNKKLTLIIIEEKLSNIYNTDTIYKNVEPFCEFIEDVIKKTNHVIDNNLDTKELLII